jgi:arylsulfatase A-like enzyme
MNAIRPNMLFFFPDQHRPDWLGLNPALPLRTPFLDDLARRGVRFTHAFTPSPLCSPARACLATGRSYSRCGVLNNGQNTPLTLPTYYRALRDSGYTVAGVGKFDLHKPGLNWGLDGRNLVREYGFTDGVDNEGKGDAIMACLRNGRRPKGPYLAFLESRGLLETHLRMYEPYLGQPGWLDFPAVTDLPDEAYCDNWVADNARRFLRDFPRDRPWHLVVNFTGPHGPFDVTADMHRRWQGVELPDPHDNHEPDRAVIRERRRNYAAMIENIDRLCAGLAAEVAARGEADRTLIVYSSDHGEMLGDHGRWGKSVWYQPSGGIPLIVAGPGVEPGVASRALVQLHDLAATFLDFAGAPALPESDALSLRPLLEGRTGVHREVVVGGLINPRRGMDRRMACDGRFKLVLESDQPPILFDLESDPCEDVNVAADHPGVVRGLADAIARERLAQT